MVMKNNFSIKKYKDIIFFLVVAIICVLLLVWVLITCVEADESNVHTVEGVISNPEIIDKGRLSWVSFDINGQEYLVLRKTNAELIYSLAEERTMVKMIYPEHIWYDRRSLEIPFYAGGAEQVIRMVNASDGSVYYDYVEEHNKSMKIDRIVFSIILSFLLLVSVGLLALSIYTDIICRSKSKKKPKEQRVRAQNAVLTPEQRKNRSQARRRNQKKK